MKEELLRKILNELKLISKLESQGPDGDVLFNKLDSVSDELSKITETLTEIEHRLNNIEINISQMSVG